MSQKNKSIISPIKNIISYIGLALLFFIIIGLFSVNYILGSMVIVGAIIYFPLIKFIKINFREIFLFLVILAISCLVMFTVGLPFNFPYSPGYSECPVSYYLIVASPQTNQLESIKFQEFIVLRENTDLFPSASWTPSYVDNQLGFQLPEKNAKIEHKGFILNEVSFQSSIFCSSSTFIKLNDFPLNSFFAAHHARDLQKYSYVDTETITWNSTSENVRFSYITPPFQVFKPILNPLVGASSVNQWLIGLVGIIGVIVFTPFFKPIITEIIQKLLKYKKNNPDVQTRQTVRLIVSKKGEEKEIEVKKKN